MTPLVRKPSQVIAVSPLGTHEVCGCVGGVVGVRALRHSLITVGWSSLARFIIRAFRHSRITFAQILGLYRKLLSRGKSPKHGEKKATPINVMVYIPRCA